MPNYFLHQNTWDWGRSEFIVIADGAALCQVSVETDNPSIAWLTDLSVCELSRGRGYGNQLLKYAKERARAMGAAILCIWVDSCQWMLEWYIRNGFRISTTKGQIYGLTFDLTGQNS